jgi:hypothetical protein
MEGFSAIGTTMHMGLAIATPVMNTLGAGMKLVLLEHTDGTLLTLDLDIVGFHFGFLIRW